MDAAFSHEDEGTAHTSPSSVIKVMNIAKSVFPGIVTSFQLARSLDVILSKRGFKKETTLLATSFCPDEVCRDVEDELRNVFGQNFSFGGIGKFPLFLQLFSNTIDCCLFLLIFSYNFFSLKFPTAGFPFGGCTSFGALCHHVPSEYVVL